MNLSFIKLDINILDDPKIKFILKLPDGDRLFRFWIGLLTLAMGFKTPGIIEIGEGIPFTAEMLATHFDLEIITVKLALDVFQRFKMVEVWDGSTLFITNFTEHQQLNRIAQAREVSRLSSRKYREKIKLLGDGHDKISDRENKTILDIELDKELTEEFENIFWNPYNKKINKLRCFKKWKSLDSENKKKIEEHIPVYINSTPDKKYRKHPLTYLSNESWSDEVIIPNSDSKNNQPNTLLGLKRNF